MPGNRSPGWQAEGRRIADTRKGCDYTDNDVIRLTLPTWTKMGKGKKKTASGEVVELRTRLDDFIALTHKMYV